jgi:hypothetical protein
VRRANARVEQDCTRPILSRQRTPSAITRDAEQRFQHQQTLPPSRMVPGQPQFQARFFEAYFSVQTFMVFMPVSASVLVLNIPLSTTVVVVVVGFLSTANALTAPTIKNLFIVSSSVYAHRENHQPQLKFRGERGNGLSTGPLSPRNTIPRDFGRSKKRGGYYPVPLGRYFFFVGSLLLAMLFAADWYLPDSSQSFVRESYVDKSIIRIKSARKWPERIVIDTSLPTTVPPPSALLANVPLTNQPREAFAQLDASSQPVSRNPLPASAKPKAAKKATRTRVAAYREPPQDSMPEVSSREVPPREVLPAGW